VRSGRAPRRPGIPGFAARLLHGFGGLWIGGRHERVVYHEGAQPPVSVTLRRILSSSYPGAIYLLHASSRSNVNALARAIHGLKAQGYGFATLDELR
jgi:peptidoglycan/xylan/chitin deacetylase (PgdA/CDA1 family)